MTPEMKRFLTARFLTMLCWIVLLGAGFALFGAMTSHIADAPLRWMTNMVTLLGSIKFGLMIQRRVLTRVDPDGSLRAQVANADGRSHRDTHAYPVPKVAEPQARRRRA